MSTYKPWDNGYVHDEEYFYDDYKSEPEEEEPEDDPNIIRFTIDGPPRVKERPRYAKGRMYTPQRTADYEKKVGEAAWLAAQQAGIGTIDKPVHVSIILKRDRADVTIRLLEDELASSMRGDIDNYGKAILDGMQRDKLGRTLKEKGEPLLGDDKQVVGLAIYKYPRGTK